MSDSHRHSNISGVRWLQVICTQAQTTLQHIYVYKGLWCHHQQAKKVVAEALTCVANQMTHNLRYTLTSPAM